MTIDSEVIGEANTIEHRSPRHKSNLRVLSPTLASILSLYTILGVANTSSAHQKREVQPPQISITSPQAYRSPNEKLFNNYSSAHEVRIGSLALAQAPEIQTYVPEESVIIARNFDLQSRLSKIHRSSLFEGKNLRKMLEEAYQEFRKERPELSNENAYYKFFEAYANTSFSPIQQTLEELRGEMAILPVLMKHPASRRITLADVRFYGDGRWEVVRFELIPEFRGNNENLLDFYRKSLGNVPKEFMAPEVAGLQSPFQARYWHLNRYFTPQKR